MKTKPVKCIFLFLLCCLINYQLPAQSEAENLERYWNYRDRFRKWFVKIGKDAGEGMAIHSRDDKAISPICTLLYPNDLEMNWVITNPTNDKLVHGGGGLTQLDYVPQHSL